LENSLLLTNIPIKVNGGKKVLLNEFVVCGELFVGTECNSKI
jgi:hypothetical protein